MRGSPRHSGDMQLVRLVAFALTGFLIGGALGYMFIGTAHAVWSPCCSSITLLHLDIEHKQRSVPEIDSPASPCLT